MLVRIIALLQLRDFFLVSSDAHHYHIIKVSLADSYIVGVILKFREYEFFNELVFFPKFWSVGVFSFLALMIACQLD